MKYLTSICSLQLRWQLRFPLISFFFFPSSSSSCYPISFFFSISSCSG